MNVALRLRLLALGAIVVAVWLAWQLAHENYALPAIVSALAAMGIVVVWLRAPLGAILLGFALFGYLVGNRGFAQLMPAPWLPLLPAEFVLLAAGAWWLVQCAFERRLPFRNEALNWVILGWLVAGTGRLMFDIRPFGLMAVRDYAMIYYASFFFLAQHLATDARARQLLLSVLVAASLAQPAAALLAELFPEFFLTTLVVRGNPLIYFKGDLALTFTVASALLLAFLVRKPQRWWAWPLATVELLYVMGGDNRASMLGAVVALGWLAWSRARRFVLAQIAVIALAFLSVTGLALLAENDWARVKYHGITERVVSLGDFFGGRTYVSEESFMKGDNNRFRVIWWRSVIDETLVENPIFGLGFGHDLARNFLQEYNPDMAEDFTARSPHSIAVSAFGRMGLVGFGLFLLLCGILTVRTFRAMRHPSTASPTLGLWTSLWAILVSACFGVVLEGPMGAVVFWTLLGLASATTPTSAEADPLAEAPDPALPAAARTREFAPVP